MTVHLNDDPRWQRLHDNTWTCPCCGQNHGGLFDIACDSPDNWHGSEEWRPNSELRASSNILTEDFCIIAGEHYLVRCVLLLPIIGSLGSHFGWGAWCSLWQADFELYTEVFDSDERSQQQPWLGRFSNNLPGYPETFNLQCRVHPQDNRQRPLIELEPTDHPLSLEQQNGITLDRILELYAINGHDMRDALST